MIAVSYIWYLQPIQYLFFKYIELYPFDQAATLIFKNITFNSNNEKNVLAAVIAKVLPNTTSEVTVNFTERAHHINSNKKREGPLHLQAKTKSWDTYEELKSVFINTNQSGTSRVFVSQMYPKEQVIRRNEVLKL